MINLKSIKNKRGDAVVLIYFFLILFVVLMVGFLMITGSAITNWIFDEAVPELTNLGVVGDANMTEIASSTITPVNNIVQNFTWVTGVLYVIMIIGSIGFAVSFRSSPNKWLIGLFLLLSVVLIIGSIFMSNIYEEFQDGNDELAIRLQEHTLLNFMILYSPMILTIIVFVTGVIMFSGVGQESFV